MMINKVRTLTMAGRIGASVAALVLGIPVLYGQAIHPVSGRHIASAEGAAEADNLDRAEREREDQPEKALDALDLHPGMVVADVGAGTGYITTRLAKRVGPSGKVYAEDVEPEMLDRLRANVAQAQLANVEIVPGTETDPKLPAGRLDLALLVDVYHELSEPQQILRNIRRSLKPDGRLVLIEYRKEDPTIPIRDDHRMSIADAKAEVEAEGYRLNKVLDDLPRQHIFIFTLRPPQ